MITPKPTLSPPPQRKPKPAPKPQSHAVPLEPNLIFAATKDDYCGSRFGGVQRW
jgi:hypothetical protein